MFPRLSTPSRWAVPLPPPPGRPASSRACCLQVEHDPPHGERVLLAHQERDCVSGRNPAGPVLHPLFAQVRCCWYSRPISFPRTLGRPPARPCCPQLTAVSLSALCPTDPGAWDIQRSCRESILPAPASLRGLLAPEAPAQWGLGECHGGARYRERTSSGVSEQSQLGSWEGRGCSLRKEIHTGLTS